MLKAYADENVANAVVQAVRTRGMDVVTVFDRGHEEADDTALLAEALADKRVLLTNDQDFLALAAEAPPVVKCLPPSSTGRSNNVGLATLSIG